MFTATEMSNQYGIIFVNENHMNFYTEQLEKSKKYDVYHKALFYTLGILSDTRRNIELIYDFKEHSIKTTALRCSWQTSGSIDVCRMAFNLFNGFVQNKNAGDYTPYNLFASGELRDYFIEAIRIRFG